MADYTDVVKLPSLSAEAAETVVGGYDILYSMEGKLVKGGVLASGQGDLPAGAVLGTITASEKYGLYDNGNSDGTETASAILLEAADATSEDKLVNVLLAGRVKTSRMSGLDANAITDLNGREDTVREVFIF